MRDTALELERWLRAGGKTIGQVAISPSESGWELRHKDEGADDVLDVFSDPGDARTLANLDDSGAYRALKTAPNLRRGWRLVLPDVSAVRLALDYFYPAMLGVWLARREGELSPVELGDTLGRQTGMYRVTQKLTTEQAQRLIAKQCRSTSCLKTILWRVAEGVTVPLLPPEKFREDSAGADALPLLCHEACNILVAAARKMVKDENPGA